VRIYRRDDMDLEPSADPAERNELLRALIELLPPEEELVVSLYFFGKPSKTMKQIAEETNQTAYQVKGLLSHGLDNLRSMLRDFGVGPVPAEHDPSIGPLLSALEVVAAGHDA
jgi:DNA-directed RNA polymerase specialized sigma subunit